MIKRFHSCHKIPVDVAQDDMKSIAGRFPLGDKNFPVCPYCHNKIVRDSAYCRLICKPCKWQLDFYGQSMYSLDMNKGGRLRLVGYNGFWLPAFQRDWFGLIADHSLNQILNTAATVKLIHDIKMARKQNAA